MSRLFKIGQAAKKLGVSVSTLRRWESEGSLVPARKTQGGTRYYSLEQLTSAASTEVNLTVAYARVSSHDHKNDLVTQAKLLGQYCTAKGWNYEVIQDIGSGMNYRKKRSQTIAGIDFRS